ncbi:878027c0-c7ae-4b9a-a16f-cbb918b51f7b [Sclerotinia trifoliorum]|uniref:878027c0-c7ae-4b9a-a16f-cbb918b51f7b n=1 Tax=Sclerotinia trifoliorum TaxID=28548 RepID=A0A8H2VNV8_9HELO|nr:878027c0-c7ae-4b9a-a16f-cbb918b51f7b [Sclerotinia trifoliorum]
MAQNTTQRIPLVSLWRPFVTNLALTLSLFKGSPPQESLFTFPVSPHLCSLSTTFQFYILIINMFSKAVIIAIVMGLGASAAPTSVTESTAGSLVGRDVPYQMFTGDGSHWPDMGAWTNFDTMWANSQAVMTTSCTQFGAANNSPAEIADIKYTISSTSAYSGIDPRFILAIVMQESGGCVRAPTTFGENSNPGIMQGHNGYHSCNRDGTIMNPCPAYMIAGMIRDGSTGTLGQPGGGDGLQQCLAQSGSPYTARGAYTAARIYNSGSHAWGTDLGEPSWGTSCYASDVANRLLGWAGPATPCTLSNPIH